MTDWLDREEYPFTCHFFPVPPGKIHYLDEGSGHPVVMVHGNPVWSFSYRHLVKTLKNNHRCIVPDHIGFGLSDKPQQWDYRPEHHADNLERLIDGLSLRDITLVVSDWGGPMGLSYALKKPENVKRIVLFNTWMWPVNRDWYYWMFSMLAASPPGRFLIERFNLFAKIILKLVYADKSKLSRNIHQHFLKPLDTPAKRRPTWIFPKHFLASGEWLDRLWTQVDKIKDKPVLIMWGMEDRGFREKELKQWTYTLTNFMLYRLPDAGHLPQEEQPGKVVPVVLDFLE